MGQKRTWRTQFRMSALPPKADIVRHGGNVRFVPIADSCTAAKRPLAEWVLGAFPPCGDEARRIAVTSFCGKPKRKDMRALFCAAHLVLNTLVDQFGALVEW